MDGLLLQRDDGELADVLRRARRGLRRASISSSPSSTPLGDAPVANARPGSLSDLFFFSVETTSTVGYGDMHPQTMYGHVVATGENFIGLVMLAVMTGLVFARFSRPRARLIFARNPVIAEHDGTPTLIFRLANARNSLHQRGDRQTVDAARRRRTAKGGGSSAFSRCG